MDIILRPIGKVHSSEHISDQGSREDYWGDTVSEIRLGEKSFTPDALEGLGEFSHVEVLFHLHSVREDAVVSGLRHPRSNPDWPPVGIFAQRGKARPNRIAATVCRLLSVQGLTLRVQALDALDGSPVLDINRSSRNLRPSELKSGSPSGRMN
jgi:tRNA-Thr(GGU) m(6)t(6)A37 methyltransferase TsaA